MFTGIIEDFGKVLAISKEQDNFRFQIACNFLSELKVDQSIAHDGVCLTIESLQDNSYEVVAIKETLEKTNLSSWSVGRAVNLERSMRADGRFDGHIVQGHVDTKGRIEGIIEQKGSWNFEISYESNQGFITVEKGSICVNGVSLTVVQSKIDRFSLAIIPYTFDHTNFKYLKSGEEVNLEFDIVGKYLQKFSELNF